MKVYQVQSQQSSYATKQNFGRLWISSKAQNEIENAVEIGCFDRSVKSSEDIIRLIDRSFSMFFGGELQDIIFHRNYHTNAVVIAPTIKYSPWYSDEGALGFASTKFSTKPGVDELIPVLKQAYKDAQVAFDKL